MNKKMLIIASLLVLLAAIPASFLLSQSPQESRSRAAASSTLYYTPNTSVSTPIFKNLTEAVPVDVMIDPGTNLASVVTLEMNYDATKFDVAAVPFTVNTAAFPSTLEGPVVLTGKVLISVSIGSDTTKAIGKVTKVGTLNLVAKSPTTTNNPTVVTFGTKSQILSVATQDVATENVLATSNPAYVVIQPAPVTPTVTPTVVATNTPLPSAAPTVKPTATPVPTVVPSATPKPTIVATAIPTVVPSDTPVPTEVPTLTPIPTDTLTPLGTQLTFDLALHGIGSSGDNANPAASDFSNKNPLHQQRDVTIQIYNDQNILTSTKVGTVIYNQSAGTFTGAVELGSDVPEGDYTVRVKENTHLRRLVPGIQHIAAGHNNIMPGTTLVAGDGNGDNVVNILDYNLLIGCYSDLLPAIDCDDTRKVITDLNDDGGVNQFDYNLFLREITVQAGN